ncbi:hypothetical protein [Photobacterium phosphoreum]|uniref:hypothetical protein n=1 Tax=Photobacterium phosphoreum TaxID=659 RepID=UPI001E414E9A|nr:hypothetical protein [Photobacterium phosphoreum]MCD9506438.1 hypothetical protein [Photobacterium phosphoreum]
MKLPDLVSYIKLGLSDTWKLNFKLVDEPFESIKPEYFTTTKVCESLANLSGSASFPLVIRAEEKTKTVVNNIKFWNSRGDNTTRNGNIDITLYRRSNGLEETVGIVEIKNFLKLKVDQSLDQKSKNEVKKDLIRNAELIEKSISYGGSLDFSGFTFYVNDNKSIVKTDGDRFVSKIKSEMTTYVKSVLNNKLPQGVAACVEIETIRSNLFSSQTEAFDLDCDGCQNYISENLYHSVLGVVYLHNSNSIVVTT